MHPTLLNVDTVLFYSTWECVLYYKYIDEIIPKYDAIWTWAVRLFPQ